MKLEASNKVAQSTKKPKIQKGYLPGRLLQVKERKDKEGNWIEGKYGRQIILLFEIFKDGKPVPNPENISEGLVLATVLNSQYKDKDGTYRTAITKNARISKVFEALSWKFTPDGFDTDDFIGKWAELNIDDYEAKDEEGNIYKASSIKDINKWEGDEPSSTSSDDIVEEKPKTKKEEIKPELQEKVDKLKDMHKEGLLSDDGLAKALESIENGS